MPEMSVQFMHGQHEGIDPKVLPNGWLSQAKNVRFKKDGRLGSRFGYAFVAGSQGQMVAGGAFGPSRSAYVKARASATVPAIVYDRHDDGTYLISGTATTNTAGVTMGAASVGVPRRVSIARNLQYTAAASDMTYGGGFIWAVVHDREYLSSGDNGIVVNILDSVTHATVGTIKVDGGSNPKIVACGSNIIVVYANGNNIKYARFTASAPPTIQASGTLVVASAGQAYSFDVAPYDATNFLLIYQQGPINLRWSSVNGSTLVATTKHDIAIANNVRPSIAREGSGSANVVLVWAEGATFNTGNVNWLEDTFAGAAVVTKTTIDSSGLAVGFPVAGGGSASANAFGFAWARSDQLMGTYWSGGSGSAVNIGVLAPFSKPFAGPGTSLLMWVANYASTGQTSSAATYKLVDLASILTTSQGAVCECIAAQHVAMAGAYMTTSATNQTTIENRRQCVSIPTQSTLPSVTAVGVSMPTVATNGSWGVDLVRLDSGDFVDKLLPARINGQLIFSGPRVQEFDGSSFFESGIGDGPEYTAAADAGAGAIGAGTYQYVFTYEWYDARGLRHRSPPSTPVSVTIAASHNIALSFNIPPFSAKFGINITGSFPSPGVLVGIWRTLAGGSVFYFVKYFSVVTHQKYDGAVFTNLTDSSTDATISVNEVLYTQGARGGASGLLANDEPPPCRFIWAGNNRVIMGGLEEPTEVRWSKLVFPGEPLQYSSDPAFKSRIDAEVTAVACLDGLWYVGSRDSIFAFSGDGPDDTGGNGTFGDPRKLPSDIGFYSQRSLVEVQQGLLFQGRADRIYLLPRGQNAPVWIGQQVRDTLALYPVITDAQLLPDENIVVFSCMNTGGTDGVLLIYDTRINEWTIDVPFNGAATSNRVFHCLNAFGGKVVLDGQIAETSTYVDDETGAQNRAIVETIVTGDIRPFAGAKPGDSGVLGHGRMRRATVLSEYRSATTWTLESSLDGGVTWSTPASYTPSNSAGDSVKTAYDLPVVRGENFRFRFISTPTAPGEGFVFNGMTCEVWQEKGSARLADAYRQ